MHGPEIRSERRDGAVVAERTRGELCNAAHRIPVRGTLRFWAGLAWLLCWITAVGCRSTGQADSTILASVVLRGNTPGQIGRVTSEVFQKHEYTVAEAGLDRLVFEKKGSGMNNLAYGSWLPDEPIWVRVRASIVPVGEEAFRLQCRAWLVRDRGSAAEEEIKIGHMHHRPYDELLGEVAARLGVKAAAPP